MEAGAGLSYSNIQRPVINWVDPWVIRLLQREPRYSPSSIGMNIFPQLLLYGVSNKYLRLNSS